MRVESSLVVQSGFSEAVEMGFLRGCVPLRLLSTGTEGARGVVDSIGKFGEKLENEV